MTSVLARHGSRLAVALGAVAVVCYVLRLYTDEPRWGTTCLLAVGLAILLLLLTRTARVEGAVRRVLESEVSGTGQHRAEDD